MCIIRKQTATDAQRIIATLHSKNPSCRQLEVCKGEKEDPWRLASCKIAISTLWKHVIAYNAAIANRKVYFRFSWTEFRAHQLKQTKDNAYSESAWVENLPKAPTPPSVPNLKYDSIQ